MSPFSDAGFSYLKTQPLGGLAPVRRGNLGRRKRRVRPLIRLGSRSSDSVSSLSGRCRGLKRTCSYADHRGK